MKKTLLSLAILTLFFLSNTSTVEARIVCTDDPDCAAIPGATCRNPTGADDAGSCVNASGQVITGNTPVDIKAQSSTERFFKAKEVGIIPIVASGIGDLPAAPGGIGAAASLMNNMYAYRPASTGYYIAYLKEKGVFPGVQPAYAQTGFAVQAFSPVLKLWELSRNIALLGFTVIFVVVGFMIMLRSKIDPRTVITIQQAIPKLAVGILLVLFSYALVGLVIDVVNVGTRIVAQIMQDQGLIAQTRLDKNTAAGQADLNGRLAILLNSNIFALFQQLYNVDNLVIAIGDLSEFNTIAQVLQLDQLLSGGGITRTVLWIAMFVAVIRTFFMLLTNYLIITFYVIFAPFQFLMMALPGQGDFWGWLRKLLSRVAVFPVTFFMLALAAVFLAKPDSVVWYTNSGDSTVGNVWRVGEGGQVFREQNADPNYQAYWSPVGLGNWGDAVGPLLTLAIVLTVPKAADMVREAIDPKGRPGAGEGEAGKALQSAASRIPMLGSFTRG